MASLIKIIQTSVLENAAKIAMVHDEQSYTYQELEFNSNRLANYLSQHGVKKESKVLFLLHRSPEVLTTILALWKLGVAYIPLDPKTPTYRIKHILMHLCPDYVISEPSLLNKVSVKKIPIVTFKDLDYLATQSIPISQQANIEELLAYIIYTSGSTGEPKGVMLTHSNITNHVLWLVQQFQFSSEDCFSFNSSMAFDFTVATTIIPLAVGAKIIITREEDTLELDIYFKQLEQNKVTFVKWTPSYFRLLLDYVETNQPNLSSLRYIMLAGEELLRSMVERWLKIYPSQTFINEYGPTETAVGITTHTFTKKNINKKIPTIPIGLPAPNSLFYVVDEHLRRIKDGQIGELLIGGASVARGYYKEEMLTQERFIENPFSKSKEILYRTGDLVQKLPNGEYLYIGRIDNQLKVNGYRVELNEIEHWILQYKGVKHSKVIIEKRNDTSHTITAYLVLNHSISIEKLRDYLSQCIPDYMIPTNFVPVSHLPCNKNGKVDAKALKIMAEKSISHHPHSFLIQNPFLSFLVDYVKKRPSIQNIDLNASFFSLGLTSLLAAELVTKLNQQFHLTIKIHDLFAYPTLSSFAAHLESINPILKKESSQQVNLESRCEPIAIIAMDCRLPGADDDDMLWELCRDGKETITNFAPKVGDRKHEVFARGVLKDIEYFDADFFNFTPKEAHLSDPQHRLLIESAWRVLEKAGYIPNPEDSHKTGVFVSMNDSTYLLNHNVQELLQPLFSDRFTMQRLMSSQCLATKIAYHLNCTGPVITAQTACSSSLVSIVLACQQLASKHCHLAIAGGISLVTPQETPYIYQQGNIFSPDGHCRPFDANALGTVFSNGLGLVVLKRLTDALRDNDTIISILKGYSINNDGSQKMSFTAPSIGGQMTCILSALKGGNVDVDTIQYIETHGTGTLIGDPMEIDALTKAFQMTSHKKSSCALGALKANIGHTHVAAGVAGLIKTSLALQHKLIPPLIHFSDPNPHIDWEHSPFYVNTRLQYWESKNGPRRAGVSAFGVGGTNAHVILEEAPESKPGLSYKQNHLLLLSAKTEASLAVMHDDLIHFLNTTTEEKISLADIAYTLQVGRKKFKYQSAIICKDRNDAVRSLKKQRDNFTNTEKNLNHPKIVFLFPDSKIQYLSLSSTLYESEPTYKKYFDECLSVIKHPAYEYNILLSIQYALAMTLIEWGIQPDVLIGYGLGEYVMACIANGFSFADALKLINQSDKIQERNKPFLPCFSGSLNQWITEFNNDWIQHLVGQKKHNSSLELFSTISDAIVLKLGPEDSLVHDIKNEKSVILSLFPTRKTGKNTLMEQAIITLWSHNIPINWNKYHQHEKRGRVALPTYPFQKKRFWFDEILNPQMQATKSNVLPTFYTPTWMRSPDQLKELPIDDKMLKKHIWIIFDDNSILSQWSIQFLISKKCTVFILQKGLGYKSLSQNKMVLDPKNHQHYQRAINSIVQYNINQYAILHFWSTKKYEKSSQKNDLNSPILFDGLFSGLFLIQAFHTNMPKAIISAVMVTTQLQKVSGSESHEPLKSSILSLCRVLPLENHNHLFSAIDLEVCDGPYLSLYATNIIQTALQQDAVESLVIESFRHSYRWRLIYQPYEAIQRDLGEILNPTGIYFITGGLGAMGLSIAHWLSEQLPCKLLLLSRTPLPKQEDWDKRLEEPDLDDGMRKKLNLLKQIVKNGAQITLVTGDIADYGQMKELTDKTQTEHGPIKGVFHLAGVSGEGIGLLKNKNNMLQVMSPKIQGAWVLSKLFKNKNLDFMVFASSLTAIAGGIGQLDYCAANLFLDHFLSHHAFKKCKQLLSINWNSWSSIGMATNVQSSKTHEELYLENSVTPEEGMKILGTLLTSHHQQVIISHVAPEIERKRIMLAFERSLKEKSTIRQENHALSVQEILKQIWSNILGVNKIHEKDTFYSLGGDSLLAIQLLEEIESRLSVQMTLQELTYQHTTRTLAKLIETKPIHQEEIIFPLLNKKTTTCIHQKSVYFIHPLGGSVLCYFPLAHHLASNVSYFAIQDPEIAKGQVMFHSIGEMAKYYASEIRANTNEQEIILIGASFGGNVCVEMVSYLKELNITVKKIILIDSWANIDHSMTFDKDNHETESSESLRLIRNYYGALSLQYQLITKRLIWLREYTPSKIDTEIILFCAKKLLPFYQKMMCENNGWTPFSSKPIIHHQIDGTHDTMLQTNYLPKLCKLLNRFIV